MIRSMTAYARQEFQVEWGNAYWDIFSVNQRYIEIYFRLPEQFKHLEFILRERIRSHITRGKLECCLHFEFNLKNQEELLINKMFAKQIIKAARWIKSKVRQGEINPIDILRWPGVIVFQERDISSTSQKILVAFDNVINDLILMREREGNNIKSFIENRLEKIKTEIKKIRSQMPEILQWQKNNLLKKIKDAQIQFDKNRLEQESILIAHRIDIAEELDRLEAHVNEIYNILCRKEAVGRRLDFMMQECNRESNTLASKSINKDITNSAIELKVLIEQIREHIQNIE